MKLYFNKIQIILQKVTNYVKCISDTKIQLPVFQLLCIIASW